MSVLLLEPADLYERGFLTAKAEVQGDQKHRMSLWGLSLGLLVHTFYRTKQGTKLAHVQKGADSSSLVRRAANDMAKRVDTGEDEGMGLPTQSTFYSNFPSNILNESA